MSFIKDTFSRMDLQQLRQFMLYGVEEVEVTSEAYDKRLKSGSEQIYKRLDEIYPESDERDRATDDLAQALTAYETVYMEIGMKAGAKLIYQLLIAEDC